MKTLQLTLVAPLIALGLLVAATASRADTLPGHYPKAFAMIGTLDGIDTHSQSLVIGDRNKRYDANIKVHTQNSQFSSLDMLRLGMTVGASLSVAGEPRITEIWVLPKGYQPPAPR